MVPTKTCITCGNAKPCELFGKDRSRKDGLESRCRGCRSARHAATYVPKGRRTAFPQRRKYREGHRFGALTLIARLDTVNGSAYVRCRCDCGNTKRMHLPSLASGAVMYCADRRRHRDPRLQTDITYSGAHTRVQTRKGRARDHSCRCGRPAEQWAYLHSDQSELADKTGKDAGKPYSADPAHYTPLCRQCHTRWDRARRTSAPPGISLVHVVRWMATYAFADDSDVFAAPLHSTVAAGGGR